jgi:hypothetical protein
VRSLAPVQVAYAAQQPEGNRANDFSKIQGRFYTRPSLSSTNTDEVMARLKFGNLMAKVKAITGRDE